MLIYAHGNCDKCGNSLSGDVEQSVSVTCIRCSKQSKKCLRCRMRKCECGGRLLDQKAYYEHKNPGSVIMF